MRYRAMAAFVAMPGSESFSSFSINSVAAGINLGTFHNTSRFACDSLGSLWKHYGWSAWDPGKLIYDKS